MFKKSGDQALNAQFDGSVKRKDKRSLGADVEAIEKNFISHCIHQDFMVRYYRQVVG